MKNMQQLMTWVSVKEERPVTSKDLIFLNVKGEVTMGKAFGEEVGEEIRVWIHDHIEDSNELATHWMELPLPPED